MPLFVIKQVSVFLNGAECKNLDMDHTFIFKMVDSNYLILTGIETFNRVSMIPSFSIYDHYKTGTILNKIMIGYAKE